MSKTFAIEYWVGYAHEINAGLPVSKFVRDGVLAELAKLNVGWPKD